MPATTVLSTESKTSLSFSPLPPAQELEHLENIHPGAVERLFKMAEKEQDERLKENSRLIQIEADASRAVGMAVLRGQILAAFSVLSVLGLCAYFGYLGHVDVGGDTAKYTVVALAAAFLGYNFKAIKASK